MADTYPIQGPSLREAGMSNYFPRLKLDPLLRIEDGVIVYDAIFSVIFSPSASLLLRRFGGSKLGESDYIFETFDVLEVLRSRFTTGLYGITITDILSGHVLWAIYAVATN